MLELMSQPSGTRLLQLGLLDLPFQFSNEHWIFNMSSASIPPIGLIILAGMVIYISTFKAEVGNKLRPKSSFQGPMFKYRYGYSFLFAVCGLILSELAGTFAIFLYIRLHQYKYKIEYEREHFIDFLPPPIPSSESNAMQYCKRHGSRGRRYSRTRELSRETSPCPQPIKTSRHGSLNVPNMPNMTISDSMRDLTYFNFPPFSRETTCNTVSTSVDIMRDYSHEFSPVRKDYFFRDYPRELPHRKEYPMETLRRTTPVWDKCRLAIQFASYHQLLCKPFSISLLPKRSP